MIQQMLKILGEDALIHFRDIIDSIRNIKFIIHDHVENPEERNKMIDGVIHILEAIKSDNINQKG